MDIAFGIAFEIELSAFEKHDLEIKRKDF